jgi:hypothetical protein
MLSPEFDEANSGFLGLIHSYSQTRDYVSVDREESAALYMAEFMRDDSFVQQSDIDTDNARKTATIQICCSSQSRSKNLHRHDIGQKLLNQSWMKRKYNHFTKMNNTLFKCLQAEELVASIMQPRAHNDGIIREDIHWRPMSLGELDQEESADTTQNPSNTESRSRGQRTQ